MRTSDDGGRACGLDPRLALFGLLIATLTLAALALACDGGSSSVATTTPNDAPTPTAANGTQTTPTPSISNLDVLTQAVLQVDDTPIELLRVSATTTTNEDLAADAEDPEQELARLEATGRLLGYEVFYVPEALGELGIVAVSSAVRLYRSPEDAGVAFAEDVVEIREADWPAAYPDLTQLEVSEVERPELADKVIWQQISGFEEGEDGSLRVEDFVVMQRDRMWGFLRVESRLEPSAGRDAALDEVLDLASRQVDRIDAALAGA